MNKAGTQNEGGSPVSHLVKARSIPKAGIDLTLRADTDQCASLARAHSLELVESFAADLTVKPWQRDGLRLTGELTAEIVQSCVITFEPVHSNLQLEIDVTLLPESDELTNDDLAGEIVIDPDGPDEPERFSGDVADVGSIVEEIFATSIDPYPRCEGARFEQSVDTLPDGDAPSPFAKLAALKSDK